MKSEIYDCVKKIEQLLSALKAFLVEILFYSFPD